MTRRLTLCALAAIGALALALGAGAQVPNLEARLEALTPSAPMAYFRLAEEVAYENTTPSGVELARRLYLLAYLLDEERGGQLSLGASVALALADLERSEEKQTWLRSLAQVLAPGDASPRWGALEPLAGDPHEHEHELAVLLGEYRAGRYRDVKEAWENEELRGALHRYDDLLRAHPVSAIDAELRTHSPLCRVCRNRRYVPSDERGGVARLCTECLGDPGPGLTRQGLEEFLLLESLLLDGEQRSWSAQLLSDGGEPLRAVDPQELSATYGVDASEPVYREGEWTTP